MTNLAAFIALEILIIGGFGLITFLFIIRQESRLERRIDRLESRMDRLETEMRDGFRTLRRELAEKFRAQRAEVAAQITAITNAIIASRRCAA